MERKPILWLLIKTARWEFSKKLTIIIVVIVIMQKSIRQNVACIWHHIILQLLHFGCLDISTSWCKTDGNFCIHDKRLAKCFLRIFKRNKTHYAYFLARVVRPLLNLKNLLINKLNRVARNFFFYLLLLLLLNKSSLEVVMMKLILLM